MDRGDRAASNWRQHGLCVADAAVAREQARGSGGGRRAGAGAGERQWWPAGGEGRRTSGSEDKTVFYTFVKLKKDYYTRCGVLETKLQFHDVLKTKSAFTVCST